LLHAMPVLNRLTNAMADEHAGPRGS
jgi:hypothetical protein